MLPGADLLLGIDLLLVPTSLLTLKTKCSNTNIALTLIFTLFHDNVPLSLRSEALRDKAAELKQGIGDTEGYGDSDGDEDSDKADKKADEDDKHERKKANKETKKERKAAKREHRRERKQEKKARKKERKQEKKEEKKEEKRSKRRREKRRRQRRRKRREARDRRGHGERSGCVGANSPCASPCGGRSGGCRELELSQQQPAATPPEQLDQASAKASVRVARVRVARVRVAMVRVARGKLCRGTPPLSLVGRCASGPAAAPLPGPHELRTLTLKPFWHCHFASLWYGIAACLGYDRVCRSCVPGYDRVCVLCMRCVCLCVPYLSRVSLVSLVCHLSLSFVPYL